MTVEGYPIRCSPTSIAVSAKVSASSGSRSHASLAARSSLRTTPTVRNLRRVARFIKAVRAGFWRRFWSSCSASSSSAASRAAKSWMDARVGDTSRSAMSHTSGSRNPASKERMNIRLALQMGQAARCASISSRFATPLGWDAYCSISSSVGWLMRGAIARSRARFFGIDGGGRGCNPSSSRDSVRSRRCSRLRGSTAAINRGI